MLAKISSGKSIYGVLAYNKIKMDDNTAKVLYRQKMFDSLDGRFSVRDCMDSFAPYLAMNNKTEKVVFHASLNPDPKDKLSDEQLSKIAQRYMEKLGYGNQPYIVIKHSDIQREHLHIISLRIDETGKKINDSYEVTRSMKICKELEQEFNLIPLKKGQRESEAPTKKIDYKAGDLKHQVGNVTKSIMANYHFQSFGEYRTLLEQFNVTAEEVKGEYRGKPYKGLVYSVLDENGEKVSKPFKSSLFGKSVNTEALQKHFDKSKTVIDKSNVRERLKPIIGKAMKQPNIDINSFKQFLLQQGIGCVFRQNEQGRIYGATFIDYQNRTILNGSRLGKEFSANVFNGLLNNPSERNIQPTAVGKSSTETNRPGRLSESSGVPSSAESDSFNAGLSLFEQHGTDYEAENFVREKEREDSIRKKKNKKRGRGM
ncbi:hypothetical protein M2451_002690 [Dysgonomonas sp. PFB1-18]|uniref:conjugal transfer protein MobB n=1 Tax=unclassified Dysgonomonas TaxID=2630389 RepID=UPI002473FF9C|nr:MULTISPECIES: conjugal transfer protein MobB [unclassified Dysgonomonas]MDH6309424.1 hypothetical protein [Dysgonomonas sp. PF1-14]MDH6339711.1 hypothetical protein [Dysgonomonas sp. PF1-16]MDH6381359.1 hypothetical protein [Dysgonomonas sp. PFB1-18]MDH6398574.1 hypothetical protein [Dysgonomonas sp. PF1-23]